VKNYVGKFFGQKKFRNVLERWQQVKTLVLDEGMVIECTEDCSSYSQLNQVSMIDGDLFDKLVRLLCYP